MTGVVSLVGGVSPSGRGRDETTLRRRVSRSESLVSSGTVPVESLAQWLRTRGYEVKAPKEGPPDDSVQVTIDENGHIHLTVPPPGPLAG